MMWVNLSCERASPQSAQRSRRKTIGPLVQDIERSRQYVAATDWNQAEYGVWCSRVPHGIFSYMTEARPKVFGGDTHMRWNDDTYLKAFGQNSLDAVTTEMLASIVRRV
jgi:hypothetical protein